MTADTDGSFDPGVAPWVAGLGKARDAVRQALVTRQLAPHLQDRSTPQQVVDVGCGQGDQAIALARAGHNVVGLDVSDTLLGHALAAQLREPPDVQARLHFERGDLLGLEPRHLGGYDVICCHGVTMYLPSLAMSVAALASLARPRSLISILTRNRAGIAMRAGMQRNWAGALQGLEARYYTNRLGIEAVRADEPGEVQAALAEVGAHTVAWYGVRLFSDHWDSENRPEDFDALLEVEDEVGRRDPYRSVAALTHTIATLT